MTVWSLFVSAPPPTTGKRAANRARRTQQIADAALGLFVARGIEAVTIDGVVGAAGVAKGSFYRYFEGKRGLVEHLFAETAAAVDEALRGCERALRAATDWTALVGAYQALGLALAPALGARPDVLRLYLQESRAPYGGDRAPARALADLVARRAVELTEAARASGLMRTDIPPVISALAVVGAVERVAQAALDGDLRAGPEVAAALVTLVMDGLGPA